MITDLLGPNLHDLMIVCGGKFSIKTSLLLTIQIVPSILGRSKGYRRFTRWATSIAISSPKIS
jgi:hypothetical protein